MNAAALDFEVTAQADEAAPEDAATLADYSPPVGSNLGGQESSSTGMSGFLPFAAGAALMVFLVFVTLKRRSGA